MAQRICSAEGCGRKHQARGYCGTHYNRLVLPKAKRYATVEVNCETCGKSIVKQVDSRRPVRFCSTRCRDRWCSDEGVGGQSTDWPGRNARIDLATLRHLARQGRASLDAIIRHAREIESDKWRGRARFVGVDCAWCGSHFILDAKVGGDHTTHCSARCAKFHGRAKYDRARGRFRIAPTARRAIYERDAWTCQLCGDPVDKALPPHDMWAATLDHIECQSWTLIPDHSPENLRLAHRWCNSVRSDESHYGADVLAIPA